MERTADDANRVLLTWEDPSTGEPKEWLGPLPVTIGRSPENDLQLNSNRVSRQHARLEPVGEAVTIVDLDSSNGTFVDGRRVPRADLEDGDIFQVGPFVVAVDLTPFETTGPPPKTVALRWTDPVTGELKEENLVPPVTLGRTRDNTIVLSGGRISRQHALIEIEGDMLVVIDRDSANGVWVNGTRQKRAVIEPGDTITIGDYSLTVVAPPAEETALASGFLEAQPSAIGSDATLIFSEKSDALLPSIQEPVVRPDQFPPPIFDEDIVPVAALRQGELTVEETTYLAIGGGLGSFIWVDNLVIYGADPAQVVSIGLEDKPYGRYARLCANSQIPDHERLRSNSDSTPDNIWGWPGYAVREIWGALSKGRFMTAGRLTWQIFGEPTFVQTYTPRAGDVFRSIDRESRRIGWDRIRRFGHVKSIRKTDDGRYAVAYTQMSEAGERRRMLMLAPFVHVAVGYPGVRFLPDLQRYRENTGDFKTVVNAYEDHHHVYDQLRREGGVVLIRGRGIVASRIIQRIYEVRRDNQQVAILHLLRSPLTEGNRYGRAQRPVEHHWEFQPFNWPKAAWSGDLRLVLEEADDAQRDRLLNDWGGTTTADRLDWRQITHDGLREGWYQIRFGSVREVTRGEDGKVVTMIAGRGAIADEAMLAADFIIDCTGLEARIDANPLLADMLAQYDLERNPKGRLKVANDFEIEGMRNGKGHIYAAGIMTLGGPYAAVDSFLGLQYSVQRSVDALAKMRAPGMRHLNGLRSVFQWLRWARGVKP